MHPKSLKHNILTKIIIGPSKKIIRLFSKETYIKMEYKYITGHKLHLDNPVRYTEKLQYLRLYSYPINPLVSKCTSKETAREYLKTNGYENSLIKSYGSYKTFNDIDFQKLPNQFVMKCTHASGYNYICFDKSKMDLKKLNKLFTKWLKTDYGKLTMEQHYSSIEPKIIIEELLLENGKLPLEYKIHVFNGKAKAMYIVSDRQGKIHYNNYLIDWTPFEQMQFNHWTSSKETIKKPENWIDMIIMSEKLAKPFPFVRIDLFNIDGKIYFNEMTFTPARGTLTFKDDYVDYKLGDWLEINTK